MLRPALAFALLSAPAAAAPELIIGEETVDPGVVFIFEGAVKDDVAPAALHLPEGATDVHIEARVNWAAEAEATPRGTPAGGFVPYLRIAATVVNQETGQAAFVDLTPHVNLVDNLHYARNMALPGDADALYDVTFEVVPPAPTDLALHHDWRHEVGEAFMAPQTFVYEGVDFSEIAAATRR